MAYVIPITGFVGTYGSVALHNGTSKLAVSMARQTVRAIDEMVELPDGRVVDLNSGNSTKWVPEIFSCRYFFKTGGAAALRTVLNLIDNEDEKQIYFEEVDGTNVWQSTGRMLRCYEVTQHDPNDGSGIVIECMFRASTDWTAVT